MCLETGMLGDVPAASTSLGDPEVPRHDEQGLVQGQTQEPFLKIAQFQDDDNRALNKAQAPPKCGDRRTVHVPHP